MPSRRVLWQRHLPAVKLVARVHDDAPGGQRPTEVLYLQVDRLSGRDLAGEDKLRYRFGRAVPALHRAAGSPVGAGREKGCPQRRRGAAVRESSGWGIMMCPEYVGG